MLGMRTRWQIDGVTGGGSGTQRGDNRQRGATLTRGPNGHEEGRTSVALPAAPRRTTASHSSVSVMDNISSDANGPCSLRRRRRRVRALPPALVMVQGIAKKGDRGLPGRV